MRGTAPGQSLWPKRDISSSPIRRSLKSRHHRTDAGFTLVEVLIAGAITALIAGALAHIFSTTLTFRTQLPDADSFSQDAYLGINLLGSDIRCSEKIVGVSGAKITLQNSDGTTISYAWDGSSGSPLTRQIDSGLVQPALSAVHGVSFKLETISRQFVQEVVVQDTVTASANFFREGDWDDWIAPGSCFYQGPNIEFISGNNCVGEHFISLEEFSGFYSVAVFWGSGGVGLTSDLRLDIYVIDAWDRIQYRVAHTTLSRGLTGNNRQWISRNLTTDVVENVTTTANYLLSCRADNRGMAGYLGFERIAGCDQWPTNGMWMLYSNNWGSDWSGSSADRELFYVVKGFRLENRLAERVVTQIDTLGVSYSLTLTHNGEQESYGGYLAWAK